MGELNLSSMIYRHEHLAERLTLLEILTEQPLHPPCLVTTRLMQFFLDICTSNILLNHSQAEDPGALSDIYIM